MGNIRKTLFVFFVCFLAGSSGSGWAGKEAEVYFLLDSSSSIWLVDFKKMLELVANLVSDMDIGPNLTRVGIGSFSNLFHPRIPLNNNHTKESLMDAIRQIPHVFGNTYTSRAVEGMRRELSESMTRPGVPRMSVLITDGRSRSPYWTYKNTTEAKNDGIFFFAVGVGKRIDRRELTTLASDYKKDHLYFADDFDQLGSIRPQLSANMAKAKVYINDKGTCGENTMVDTVFVYEEYSLGATITASVKRFLKSVTDDLRMNPGNIRVGVVSKTCPKGGDIRLNDFLTREEFMEAINRDDDTSTINALVRKARESYLTHEAGHRDGAEKRMVVILASPIEPHLQRDFLREMYITKFSKIETYVIRQGTDYDKEYLYRLTNSKDNVLFTDIDNASKPFLRTFCRDI